MNKKTLLSSVWVFGIFLSLLATLSGCVSESEDARRGFLSPDEKKIVVEAIYPYDATLFTQGLEMVKGRLIVGTGLYGESVLGVLSLDTGRLNPVIPLEPAYFGEGLTYDGTSVFQLTWKEGMVFIRDPDTLEMTGTFSFEGEGWGICYDGTSLITSDGSATLTFRNPKDFSVRKTITVTDKGTPLEAINELEYAHNNIYANIWHRDDIVKIDPESGDVLTIYDASSLRKDPSIPAEERESYGVLNGIAHIDGNHFYLSGKNWSRLFQVVLD